jgi:hypothetical protein
MKIPASMTDRRNDIQPTRAIRRRRHDMAAQPSRLRSLPADRIGVHRRLTAET